VKYEDGTSLTLQSLRTQNYSEKTLSQCHFFHHISNTDLPDSVLSRISEVGLAMCGAAESCVFKRPVACHCAVSRRQSFAPDSSRHGKTVPQPQTLGAEGSIQLFFLLLSLGLKHDSSLSSLKAHVFLGLRTHVVVTTYL